MCDDARRSLSLSVGVGCFFSQLPDLLSTMSVTLSRNWFLFDGFSSQRSFVLEVLRVVLNGLPPADSRRGLHGHLSIHTRLPRRGCDQLRQRCAAHPAQARPPLALRVPRTSREPAPAEPVWLPGLASATVATATAAMAYAGNSVLASSPPLTAQPAMHPT